MDAKQQKKWDAEVWKEIVKDKHDSHDVDLGGYVSGKMDNLESPKFGGNLFKKWIANRIIKKIGNDPDIRESEITMEELGERIKSAILKIGLSDKNFEHYQSEENQYEYVLKYSNNMVIVSKVNPFGLLSIRFPNHFSPRTYVHIKEINVKSLIEFMQKDMDVLFEEFKYKNEYMLHFWEHFISLPMEEQLNAFRNDSVDIRTLISYFNTFFRTETYSIREKETEKQQSQLPSANLIKYNIEGEFIEPFKRYYAKYVNSEDKIDFSEEINNTTPVDIKRGSIRPHLALQADCISGFYITINGKTVFVRILNNLYYLFFEPTTLKFMRNLGILMTFDIPWNRLIAEISTGLKLTEKYEWFYNALKTIENELKLEGENSVDWNLAITANEEIFPSFWKLVDA